MLKYSSTLIKYQPEKTLAVLIDKEKKQYFRDIDIPKLMPALRSVPNKSIKKAREYVMDQCIGSKRQTAKSVHNMAFFLYCEGDDVGELIEFLKGIEAKKESGQPICFEVDYALNLCKQKEDKLSEMLDGMSGTKQRTTKEAIDKLKEAQIILYGILNLYPKAVKMALEFNNTNLAQIYANKPEDFKTKKKLWMKIAKQLFLNSITSHKQHATQISKNPNSNQATKIKVE